MPKLLIVSTTGAQDSTRATIPFHVAVNGAAPSGQECAIALVGDATDLVKTEVSERVRGVGVPPLASLLAGCVEKGIRLFV